MKKTWALLLAAFYLSLTTGVYVCLLHCTTDFLVAQWDSHAEVRGHEKGGAHEQAEDDDEGCRSGTCSCCYHHGTYVVNENYHAHNQFTFPAMYAVPLQAGNMARPEVPLYIKTPINWPRATGPPFLACQPLYISHRTLLI